MANNYHSGSIYVDTADSLVFTGKIKVAYILMTSDSTHASAIIHDGTSISGPAKLHLKVGASHDTKLFDFSDNPLIFSNGIFVDGLSASCKLTFVTTTKGSAE